MKLNSATRPRRKPIAALGLLVAAALALGGCTAAVNQPNEGGGSTPVSGGTLTVASDIDAQPGAILGGYSSNWPWQWNVFESLIHLNPKTLKPEPVLATKWKMADDGLSFDITIRDDAKFQTGRKLTADDVKFSLEKAADPVTASQVGFIAREFSGIDVTSPTTLTITLKHPMSNIFDLLDQTAIVDKDTYSGLKDGSEVIGSGPYKWSSWNPGSGYTLTRWKGYRDKDAAKIDTIKYIVMGDSTAEVSAVRSGRADIAYGLTTTDTQAFAKDKKYRLMNAGGTIYPFGMNVTTPPFDKKEVRQAMDYAIDRKRINEQVFKGTGTITDLFWGTNAPGYSKKLAKQYTYDTAKAKKMIEDAGATGTAVPIVFMDTPITRSIYEIIANNLKEIGLKPSADTLDSPTFIARQLKGDLGPVFLGTHGQIGRSPATLLDSLPTLRKGNPSHFWTDEYDQLRNKVLSAQSTQESADALENLSKYMLDNAFVISLMQAPRQIVVSQKVQDIHVGLFSELFASGAYLTQ